MACRPVSKVFIQSSVKRCDRISLNRSRVMIKSSSSSSTRRTLIRDESQIVLSLAIRQLYSLKPVLGEEAHQFDKGIELDRLRDKGIRAEFVHFFDVCISSGGGQHHHRNPFEI